VTSDMANSHIRWSVFNLVPTTVNRNMRDITASDTEIRFSTSTLQQFHNIIRLITLILLFQQNLVSYSTMSFCKQVVLGLLKSSLNRLLGISCVHEFT